MQIVTLQTQNFKGSAEEVYELHVKNKITGRNGSGKTAIADAIVFALYGRTRSGSREVDKLINEKEETGKVAVEFETGTTVVREYSRLSGTTILLDGEKVDQATLEENLPDFKVFLSVFSLGAFANMDEDDQRELYLAITPQVDRKELFTQFVGKDIAKKFPVDFRNLDKEHKSFRNQMKTAELDLARLQGSLANIGANIGTQHQYDIEKLNAELIQAEAQDEYDRAKEHNDNLDEQIAEAEKGICQMCNRPLDKKEILITIKALESRKIELPKKPKKAQRDVFAVKADIQVYNQTEDMIQRQQQEKEQGTNDIEDEIDMKQIYLSEVKLVVDALSPKGIKANEGRLKLDSLLSPLKELVPGIEIKTMVPLKTKEDFKEVFKISRNGTEYKFLSSGEKKRMDIAISTVVNDLTQNVVNMFFLDDADLLDLEDPIEAGQVFYAYVSNQDLELEEV